MIVSNLDLSWYDSTALERGIYPMNEENNETSGRMRKKWKQMKAKMQGRYATPFYVQLGKLVKRSFLQYWRTPPDFMAKLFSPLLMGLIMVRRHLFASCARVRVSFAHIAFTYVSYAQGTLFLQLDDTQVGATERAAAVYFSLIICNLTSMRT
jgi:hypothetical protein